MQEEFAFYDQKLSSLTQSYVEVCSVCDMATKAKLRAELGGLDRDLAAVKQSCLELTTGMEVKLAKMVARKQRRGGVENVGVQASPTMATASTEGR